MPKTAKEVIQLAKDKGIKIVDVRFVDLPGKWQHFSIPVEDLDEDVFAEGLGFDGSSIRGFQQINESDMLLFPDPETAYVDPCLEIPTLSMICDVKDPVSGKPYSRDPRYIVQKAEAYLKSTGIAETSYWGPELEFYIFDNVQYDQNAFTGYYRIDSNEGIWNSGRDEGPNLGFKLRHKEGYFPVPPSDQHQDLRSEIILKMKEVGHPGGGASSRGWNRGAGRDRHALLSAEEDGGQRDVLQVHHPERVAEARQGGDVHAQADLRR